MASFKPKPWLLWTMVLVIGMVVFVVGTFHCPPMLNYLRDIFPSALRGQKDLWVLEIKTEYLQCGHEDQQSVTYWGEKALQTGLQQYPGIKLNQLKPYSLTAVYRREGLCATCEQNTFLGVSDHKVAVIRGTPFRPGPVAELTDIIINPLPEAEKNDLKAGIPFKGEKEKLQLLEGINGLIVN